MQQTDGLAQFRGFETWYRITGPLGGGKPPLVVLHGGPGATHDYVENVTDLADDERAVVHYDQLGNGRSTHLRDKNADFWTVELFLDELSSLLRHLGIADNYDLLGQSWGGMLAAEHAVLQPAGLRRLVIANSPASMELWLAEANRLRGLLLPTIQTTLLAHEQAGTTTSAEYVAATRVSYDRHLCRAPWPDGVARSFAAIEADPTVYGTMNGPSEFHVIGTLKGWSVIDRLDRIRVPTLLVSGRHDEATPGTIQPFADKIPNVRWTIFEESSHMPHIEERDQYMRVVGGFLDET